MKDDAVVAETILIASISFPFYWLYSFQEVYGGAIRGMGNAVGPMAVIIGNLCVLRLLLLEILSRVVGTLQSIAAVYPLTWGGTALCFIVLYAVTIRGKTEIVHI
jgi:Na+-driven multidrug efflux pump